MNRTQLLKRSRSSRSAHDIGVYPTRLSWKDLVGEAVASLVQRPGRTVLTMLGTVFAVGSFVTVLGLTATGSGQVSSAFSELKATQVSVADAGAVPSQNTVMSFPSDADQRVQKLNGVVHAGVMWQLPAGQVGVSTSSSPGADQVSIDVAAASPGYLEAIDPTLVSGALYSQFHEDRKVHVAVIGSGAARRLGLSTIEGQPTVFILGTGYSVVGIIGNERRDPGALGEIFIPSSTALLAYGAPQKAAPATMLAEVKVGAASLIAKDVAMALRPDAPALFRVTKIPIAFPLEGSVTSTLAILFLALAGVTLVIGAVGIANTTLVAVLERTAEIGLRRAGGARPRDIRAQVITEAAAVGTLGGLVGTSVAVFIVVATAAIQHWTALLDPWTTLSAPLLGTCIGVLAGLYPATRAGRIQPIDALRR